MGVAGILVGLAVGVGEMGILVGLGVRVGVGVAGLFAVVEVKIIFSLPPHSTPVTDFVTYWFDMYGGT